MPPPPSSLPYWAMTTRSPDAAASVTIGELDTKNIGGSPRLSFRHTFDPLAASRQDRVLSTPRVTTLPSATVGELRGPGYWRAPPVGISAGYLSCHCSLPVAA